MPSGDRASNAKEPLRKNASSTLKRRVFTTTKLVVAGPPYVGLCRTSFFPSRDNPPGSRYVTIGMPYAPATGAQPQTEPSCAIVSNVVSPVLVGTAT